VKLETSTGSSVATTFRHMKKTIGPEAGADCYSGTAAAAVAAVGRADEAREDSIAEMEYYKNHWLEDPSMMVVDYQDHLGHNVQSSYSKLGEKVMGSCCPACDGLNEDKHRYLKRILQMKSRKNSQHSSDGWPNTQMQMWEVWVNFAWNLSLFADAVAEQDSFPLSWRENEHISTHT